MQNLLINFLIFAFFGTTIEVLFTSLGNFVKNIKRGEKDFSLQGHSYLWMFFIYGGIAIIFPPVFELLSVLPLLVRLFIYGIGILIAEFILGYILEKITGHCPWHYQKGIHIRGLVRIDYLPFWMVFSYIVERVYIFFNF